MVKIAKLWRRNDRAGHRQRLYFPFCRRLIIFFVNPKSRTHDRLATPARPCQPLDSSGVQFARASFLAIILRCRFICCSKRGRNAYRRFPCRHLATPNRAGLRQSAINRFFGVYFGRRGVRRNNRQPRCGKYCMDFNRSFAVLYFDSIIKTCCCAARRNLGTRRKPSNRLFSAAEKSDDFTRNARRRHDSRFTRRLLCIWHDLLDRYWPFRHTNRLALGHRSRRGNSVIFLFTPFISKRIGQ